MLFPVDILNLVKSKCVELFWMDFGGFAEVMIRISIVVPIWNRVEYLFGCLDSIPTANDVEIIVVDDGSDVDVEKVCRCRSDYDRLRFIRQEHQGVLAARRYGCQEAIGEYVWFVDSDDEIKKIPDIPNADLVRYKQDYGWMCIGDKIYRRELALKAFDEIGDLRLRQCEDGIFYLAALQHASNIVESDEAIYRYIQRNDSTTHKFNPSIISERESLVDWIVRVKKDVRRDVLSKEAFVCIACDLCRWPLTWRQLKDMCHSLVASKLVEDGLSAIREDAYARKMMFAMRHPALVLIYRCVKHREGR